MTIPNRITLDDLPTMPVGEIAALPGDAIMLCLLVQGEAFVYHSDGCDPVRAGDAVLYDIDRPFMYGFSGAMHQVMLELPRALFHGRIGEEGVIRPRVLRFGDHDHTREWARSAARVIRRAIRFAYMLGVERLVMPPLVEVTDAYVDLRTWCVRNGHGLGAKDHEADRWVAAVALAANLPLASEDTIFDGVAQLQRADPTM